MATKISLLHSRRNRFSIVALWLQLYLICQKAVPPSWFRNDYALRIRLAIESGHLFSAEKSVSTNAKHP
jgi:hypothetical protein